MADERIVNAISSEKISEDLIFVRKSGPSLTLFTTIRPNILGTCDFHVGMATSSQRIVQSNKSFREINGRRGFGFPNSPLVFLLKFHHFPVGFPDVTRKIGRINKEKRKPIYPLRKDHSSNQA